MMFKNIDSIYNYVGQEMFSSLPGKWDKAYLNVNMDKIDRAISIDSKYISEGVEYFFDLDRKSGIVNFSDCDEAFYDLYHIMQKNEQDVPWNKARFELTPDGDFSIDFKYDEDFAWYKLLDIESQEYDELDIDIIDKIKSWEGLPSDYQRYWKK
ncbi:MAG: hypothetical protein COW15_16925 [Shewanella sp. CG12_big_fil_rev_8_21_14_0_65_47_15]|nr:MAG: hypothetical protein COW15_16925 [Shewanella sp. CG12_big_fil_rev_8_21_14_0_65_47_15]